MVVVGMALGGCSSAKRRWIQRRRTSQECLTLALEAENADDRRDGVIGLGKSRDAATDWAVKVFDTIARTDTDPMVRCAAVRAMGSCANAERVHTLLKLLASGSLRVEGVRRASGPVRWEAAKLLLEIVDSFAYDQSQRESIVQTLLERLARDDERHVRLTAVDTLAYFAQRPVPSALVDVMEEDDFTLKCAVERALIALTGTTHHRDPIAWRQWLAATDQPFANAGTLAPETLQVKSKSNWDWPWEW